MSEFENEPILSANTRVYVGKIAFADDKLDRKPLAEKLTGYLSRLNDGSVLAIDAPWGEGKTWFGRNWAKYLEDNSYSVVYIDAFEQDYVEDPFMLITSEILNIVEDDSDIEENLKKSAVEVGKTLLPVVSKTFVNILGKVALGSSDLSGEIKEAIEMGTATVADSASDYIKKSLKSYGEDKLAMQEFKVQLAEFAKTKEKPIVIFIDELDRCKPNFAVNLIERIKHFFDVPNIIFVLLLNRDQLEKAVKGVYGSETDASAYLGKFVNFFFALPKPMKDGYGSEQRCKSFIHACMKKYQFTRDNNIHDNFIIHLEMWSQYFDMSLRDIEKAIALYSFAGIFEKDNWKLVYLIVLKIKKPKLFKKLVINDKKAHFEAKIMIENFEKYEPESVLQFFIQWHKAYETDFINLSDDFISQLPFRYRYQGSPEKFFASLASNIDLSID